MFDDFCGFPRAVYVVAVGQFIYLFGSGVVYPFATLYFYGEVGIPFTLVGIGLLANNVATAVGNAVGGYLVDRFGRKPVMAASMALSFPALAASRWCEPPRSSSSSPPRRASPSACSRPQVRPCSPT
ncbi:MFS transporter [Haladaptatus halobius]|uniref:MFS transporter n=1 Tax=Haladaptatus halobius TaxID=2884875 RepID=UPI001D0B245E|nr:MFS transporter [Haladaptatus halobius]